MRRARRRRKVPPMGGAQCTSLRFGCSLVLFPGVCHPSSEEIGSSESCVAVRTSTSRKLTVCGYRKRIHEMHSARAGASARNRLGFSRFISWERRLMFCSSSPGRHANDVLVLHGTLWHSAIFRSATRFLTITHTQLFTNDLSAMAAHEHSRTSERGSVSILLALGVMTDPVFHFTQVRREQLRGRLLVHRRGDSFVPVRDSLRGPEFWSPATVQ